MLNGNHQSRRKDVVACLFYDSVRQSVPVKSSRSDVTLSELHPDMSFKPIPLNQGTTETPEKGLYEDSIA
jgi:hypothetical protein